MNYTQLNTYFVDVEKYEILYSQKNKHEKA